MTLHVVVGLVLAGILAKVLVDGGSRQRAEGRAERGRLLHDQGRHSEAARAYGEAIALDPGNARYRTGRGRALGALGRHADALGEHNAAARLDRRSSAARADVARALLPLGRAQDALASAERAVSLSPQSPEAHLAKGEALLAMNMPREAVAEMRESARIRDGSGVRTRIADVLRGIGDHAGELVELDLAIAADGDSASLQYRRGCALFLIGKADAAERLRRYREAVAAFEAALEIDRHHAEAAMALEHARAVTGERGGNPRREG